MRKNNSATKISATTQEQITPARTGPSTIGLEVTESKCKKSRIKSQATAVHYNVRNSVLRLIYESDLEISTFRQVASIAQVPEPVVFSIVREHTRIVRNSHGASCTHSFGGRQ